MVCMFVVADSILVTGIMLIDLGKDEITTFSILLTFISY